MLALFARRYPSAIGNNEGVMIVTTPAAAARAARCEESSADG